MADTSTASRSQLIIGLCLPLAVLIGYMLSEPLDTASLGVVLLIAAVLSIPILMRWHHPLLVLSWNACINPYFLPGRPYVWMLMAMASCFFAVLARTTDSSRRFLRAPAVTKPLMWAAIVVLGTLMMRGGLGLRSLGMERYGSKGYFYIALAIIGYFAFTSQAIPKERATLYTSIFFLSGLTSVISNLAFFAGPKFYILFDLFPPDSIVTQAIGEFSITGAAIRIVGLTLASQAVWCWLLMRYGLGGMFDFGRPWRGLLLLAMVFTGMFGGFRSGVLFFALMFIILFRMEKLWRSARVMIISLMAIACLGAALVLFSERLPLSVQRAISFLPVKVDAATRQDAEYSTQWRLEMWRNVTPDVPKYLFAGKGYSLDPGDLYLAGESIARGYVSASEIAVLAGDYHNGPLSIVIPFGIWGVITFGWFFGACIWVMHRNYRYGDPDLRNINRFLLALMIGRVIFFVSVYGSLYAELFQFTGLVGLSVSLNGGVSQPHQTKDEIEPKDSLPANV